MLTRRRACVLLAAAGGGLLGWKAAASADGIGPGQKIELRDMLNKGLRARRKSEFQFTDKVVGLVANGALTERIVKETFQWARRKYRHRYVYFQSALTRRAKDELNIEL